LGCCDLSKKLLLGIEVVVEGAVRHVGALGSIRDPGVEQPVALEDLLPCFDQTGPRLLALG
jgi:hypothetical protein